MTDAEPSFARPRVAAGVLFFDGAGRILMVVPSYKDFLDIPGGFVEPGESPRAAAHREVGEELGIAPPIGRLLAVDWAPGGSAEDGGDGEDKLIFLFDGGGLTATDLAAIRVDGDEITGWELLPVDELVERTIATFVRRIGQAAAARADGSVRYLESGA